MKRQGVEVLSHGVPTPGIGDVGFSRSKSDCKERFYALMCAGLFDKTCTVFNVCVGLTRRFGCRHFHVEASCVQLSVSRVILEF